MLAHEPPLPTNQTWRARPCSAAAIARRRSACSARNRAESSCRVGALNSSDPFARSTSSSSSDKPDSSCGRSLITLSCCAMAVTIRDVAADAGVSQATAARALGGYGYASPTVRRRVGESARRLGYTPNGVARALVSRSTTTVGLVVGDVENPFFAAAARGLSDVMEAAGHTVLLANADEDPGREARAIEILLERRVDGLVVAPAPGTRLGSLPLGDLPVVQLDRAVRGLAAD